MAGEPAAADAAGDDLLCYRRRPGSSASGFGRRADGRDMSGCPVVFLDFIRGLFCLSGCYNALVIGSVARRGWAPGGNTDSRRKVVAVMSETSESTFRQGRMMLLGRGLRSSSPR